MDVDMPSTNGHVALEDGVVQLESDHLVSDPPSEPCPTKGGKQPPTEVDPVIEHRQDYSHELPVIRESLIPLSLVVERVIGQAHSELANLGEM